ncbi:hypothetical protein GHT06_020168 [Daphnia sinensis]|uniref:Uncharacterized protein n=1 Tax=Daphnia sinensis TaxID=1820382 RepID=A0AAD5L292_9CRUS|nr:hypothetical protein GHT06_020168 [Daphnia sinensis]
MQLELDLQPISTRTIWLFGKYLFKIEKQSNYPMFKPCYNLRRNPISWKDHNTQALTLATSHTIMANINLFQEGDNQAPQRNGIPPWAEMSITLDYLQISKTEALTNQAKARALFYEYKMQKKNAVEAHTNGSLNKERKNTNYAVILPALNIEETGTLEEGTFTLRSYYGKSIRPLLGHEDSIQLPGGRQRIGHLYRLPFSGQSIGFP